MKLSSKLFAIAFASILSTGAVVADDITQDLLYGSQATETDFTRMPATAAGKVSHETPMDEDHGVNAIPDYLEGLNFNQ
ncbi:hypothetical protein [Sedimenticola sp.]|uniref:hypothetical protein n=1 Tax=Sedimenticola sp. TaxID=1940285 RepID=UPI00258875AF|nr:hypothetical protein [Sedimenticola sp.]MCW8902857.1 hypothetical protein [Sedimenticola sp.]